MSNNQKKERYDPKWDQYGGSDDSLEYILGNGNYGLEVVNPEEIGGSFLEENSYASLDNIFNQRGGDSLTNSYASLDEIFDQRGGYDFSNSFASLDEIFNQRGGDSLTNSYASLDEIFQEGGYDLSNSYDSLDEIFNQRAGKDDNIFDVKLARDIGDDNPFEGGGLSDVLEYRERMGEEDTVNSNLSDDDRTRLYFEGRKNTDLDYSSMYEI